MLAYSKNMTASEAKQVNALVLAFIGDGVFEVFVRDYAINIDKTGKTHVLHSITSSIVNASCQAEIVNRLSPYLTEDEEYIFRRGKNSNPHTIPKNQNVLTYKTATGFEALLGFLYVTNNKERLDFILNQSIEIVSELRKENKTK